MAISVDDKIKQAVEAINAADALLITAGAGMGVDSGLPDFRGTEGFWKAYPIIAKLGLCFEEMADPEWFKRDPRLAWAFYGHRLNLYRQTAPHDGFKQLLEIGREKPKGYLVFTSNVDGHFQKAGFAQERVVECHGSIHHFQCTVPCTNEIWDASQEIVTVNTDAFHAMEPLPRCRRCQELARPNVLMFGDGHWIAGRTQAQRALFARWLDGLEKSSASLTVIELGAGTAVPTVRHTSESVLRKAKGTLIRINPREDFGPPGHIGFPLGAAEGIRRIYERVIMP